MTKLLNYTTAVSARKSVAECHDLLAEAGAGAITTLYDNGEPGGLQFEMETPHGKRLYRLPVNVAGVRQKLLRIDKEGDWPSWVLKNPAERRKILVPSHSRDVAWRLMKDWLEVQLALIAAEVQPVEEVLLSYMMLDRQSTVYDRYLSDLAIEAGG